MLETPLGELSPEVAPVLCIDRGDAIIMDSDDFVPATGDGERSQFGQTLDRSDCRTVIGRVQSQALTVVGPKRLVVANHDRFEGVIGVVDPVQELSAFRRPNVNRGMPHPENPITVVRPVDP